MGGGSIMKYRVYIAASTQKENIGVNQYGTEQDRMQFLADRVAYWLKTQTGKFEVFRNQPGWTLQQTVNDCNRLACVLFVDNHTNAGNPLAQGTEVYYHEGSAQGKVLATSICDKIAPLSPGKDQGVLSDKILYLNGLFVLRSTTPPACLVEHIYHTNVIEVEHYLNNIDLYAKAEAQGICTYLGEKWIEPLTPIQTINLLVDNMAKDGLITDKEYWVKVLKGEITPKPEYLQVVFGKATSKIT